MVRGSRTGLRCPGGGRDVARRTAFHTAASWTYTLDSEEKRKHDFSNMVLEFRYAVEREDQMMMEYCENELARMYRERGQQTRQQ